MINACEHPRDRALVACLYESGTRISEIGYLKIKHNSPATKFYSKCGMALDNKGLKTMGEVNLWNIMTLMGLQTSSEVQTLYQIKEIKA